MKLADLHPVFAQNGGEGITRSDTGEPVLVTFGVGILFDCPCGDVSEEHRCYVPFANPIGPGPLVEQDPGWQRTGDTFETLSLVPSILRIGGCQWHGYITSGEVTS